MENFIVSARKYRPATFETVVGQKSITTTLKNAIKTNHLAHAYLFCGPRGVGKTTCARIFAKTINCEKISTETESCDECESCISFNENRSYSIHELDAASNNSVEDIRNLTDQVRIPPQIGSHSVYIIDEVHMLSSQAFNAFLKTLEEPPHHAIFILATTEKHKIIPTILSRCQIFDFNRITVEDTVRHLEYVAKSEGVEADIDGLNIIAQKADGAMRDALSYFDQIVSFSGTNITYKDVIDNLNVLDYTYYFKLTTALLETDIANAFLIFNEILNNGFDGHQFITGLSGHLRDLLVCKDKQTIVLLEVGASIKKKYIEQSASCTLNFIFKALEIANQCDINYKTSRNKRLHVEITLLKMCNIPLQNAINMQAQAPAATNTKAPQTETNKPVIKEKTENNIPNKQYKSISIKDALNGKAETVKKEIIEHKEEKQQTTTYGDNKFTQEELKTIWLKFANTKQNRARLQSMLKAHIPILKENFVIELTLENKLQEKAIVDIQNEIKSFLHSNLSNSKINLIIKVAQQKVEKKLYTNNDKFKYLNEKNSSLSQLKQKFNLDF